MQKTILFSILLISTAFISESAFSQEKGRGNKGYFKIGSAASIKNWNQTPDRFKVNDLNPALSNIGFHSNLPTSGSATFSLIDVQITALDFKSFIPEIEYSVGKNMGGIIASIGGGINFGIFSNSSIYSKTQYDNFAYNLNIKVQMGFSKYNIFGEIKTRKITEAEVSTFENVKTRVAHNFDYIFSTGLHFSFLKMELLGKISAYKIGSVAIASNEFYYKIDSETVFKFTGGVTIPIGRLAIDVKYHYIKNYNDEVSLYYQSPQLGKDYMLSSHSANVELRWNF